MERPPASQQSPDGEVVDMIALSLSEIRDVKGTVNAATDGECNRQILGGHLVDRQEYRKLDFE